MLAFVVAGWENGGMQGTAVTDRELLDAAAVCGHLLAAGSVCALLAQHRSRLFPDEMFEDRQAIPQDLRAGRQVPGIGQAFSVGRDDPDDEHLVICLQPQNQATLARAVHRGGTHRWMPGKAEPGGSAALSSRIRSDPGDLGLDPFRQDRQPRRFVQSPALIVDCGFDPCRYVGHFKGLHYIRFREDRMR